MCVALANGEANPIVIVAEGTIVTVRVASAPVEARNTLVAFAYQAITTIIAVFAGRALRLRRGILAVRILSSLIALQVRAGV